MNSPKPDTEMTPEELTSGPRNETHGDWEIQSSCANELKAVLRKYGLNDLPAPLSEALEMNCVKMSRVVCGNFAEPDHWKDMQGYSLLAEKYVKEHYMAEPSTFGAFGSALNEILDGIEPDRGVRKISSEELLNRLGHLLPNLSNAQFFLRLGEAMRARGWQRIKFRIDGVQVGGYRDKPPIKKRRLTPNISTLDDMLRDVSLPESRRNKVFKPKEKGND